MSLNTNEDLLSRTALGALSATADGTFTLHLPTAHQITTADAKVPIKCRYKLDQNHLVSLSLSLYDHSRELIIDPVMSYSSYLGGSDDGGIFGIERDAHENLYVAGETSSLNSPAYHTVQSKEAGEYDCFLTKSDPFAKHILYSTYLGGAN